jgi:hypothetical protein
MIKILFILFKNMKTSKKTKVKNELLSMDQE